MYEYLVKYRCEVLSVQLSYYSVVNLFELFCLTDVYSYDIGQLKGSTVHCPLANAFCICV